VGGWRAGRKRGVGGVQWAREGWRGRTRRGLEAESTVRVPAPGPHRVNGQTNLCNDHVYQQGNGAKRLYNGPGSHGFCTVTVLSTGSRLEIFCDSERWYPATVIGAGGGLRRTGRVHTWKIPG